MLMPCASLCLLALALNFDPSPDNQKCSYCVQTRGLSAECRKRPWVCAEWDPDSLVYCLARDEHPWGREALKRAVRCISHANLLNQSHSAAAVPSPVWTEALSPLMELASRGGQQCTFDQVQQCQCPDCNGKAGPGERQSEDVATELDAVSAMLDKLIDDEEQRTTERQKGLSYPGPAAKMPPRLSRPLPSVPSAQHRCPLPRQQPIPGRSVDFLHSRSGSAQMPPHIPLPFLFLFPAVHLFLHVCATLFA